MKNEWVTVGDGWGTTVHKKQSYRIEELNGLFTAFATGFEKIAHHPQPQWFAIEIGVFTSLEPSTSLCHALLHEFP